MKKLHVSVVFDLDLENVLGRCHRLKLYASMTSLEQKITYKDSFVKRATDKYNDRRKSCYPSQQPKDGHSATLTELNICKQATDKIAPVPAS